MRGVVDPDFRKDIVSLGFVKELSISEGGVVSFELELTTPACPVKEEFRKQCKGLLSQLSWVRPSRSKVPNLSTLCLWVVEG